jgi:hypothetical protein
MIACLSIVTVLDAVASHSVMKFTIELVARAVGP